MATRRRHLQRSFDVPLTFDLSQVGGFIPIARRQTPVIHSARIQALPTLEVRDDLSQLTTSY